MALTRVGARLARRLASATAPPFAVEPAPFHGAPKPRAFSTSAGASGGKPGATSLNEATAGAAEATKGATGAAPAATGVSGVAAGATGAAATAAGVKTGATRAATGVTDAAQDSRIFLKPLVKISSEDVMHEWKHSGGFRKGLYVGISALAGASVATFTFAYVSMENRLSNNLKAQVENIDKYLVEARAADREMHNALVRKYTEWRDQWEQRTEASERKEKERREDWERNIQLLVNEILSKIIKLEEKEWKNRHTVLQAEDVLKKFGFSTEAESHYEVAKQFKMLQFQVDYLKNELSKPKEPSHAVEMLETLSAIDSQVTALKKRILEAGIAGEADLVQTDKGVASSQKVKKQDP